MLHGKLMERRSREDTGEKRYKRRGQERGKMDKKDKGWQGGEESGVRERSDGAGKSKEYRGRRTDGSR